jgi:hypothetical protein
MTVEKNFRGDQAELAFKGEVYPVTEKSLDISTETSDSQFDDTPVDTTNKAVTGVDLSGSFSYDGRNLDLRSEILADPSEKGRIIFREEDGSGFRFNGCVLSLSRDYPSDDKAETTVDWEAEEVVEI